MSADTRSEWCCPPFKSVFEGAGERGFAVLVDKVDDEHTFFLQHRAFEPNDPGPRDHPGPIATISQRPIDFCPWCGRALAKFYRARVHGMVRPGLAIPGP